MSGVERQMFDGCGHHDDVVSTVLQLVVQHADVRPAEVARCLQLSTGVRRALQQASGNLKVLTSTCHLTCEKLTAVAHWLPSHAGLVSSLNLSMPFGEEHNSALCAATEQMLSFALQLSGCRRPLSSSNPADAPAPALQLKSFHTTVVYQPAALLSIAGSSCLTQLALGGVPQDRFTAQLCAAIGEMRALRYLSCWVQGPPADASFPQQFAAALAALTQLQLLEAHSVIPAAGLHHLPASLTSMSFEAGHSDPAAAGQPTVISISHLTKLKTLNLNALNSISAQSQLPACLTDLTLEGPAEAVLGLSELRELCLLHTHQAIPFLQQVAQQARLQRLDVPLHACSCQQLQQVFDALSSCTQLTWLQLYNADEDPCERRPSIELSGIQVHRQLSKLRQLQVLTLTQIRWDRWGPSQLTVLSALTHLRLQYCDMADTGLGVLFHRLTGLRMLDVAGTLPASELLLVPIGCLTNLEFLCSRYNDLCLTADSLPSLSPLTKLTSLTWYGNVPLSESVERASLDGMPHLRAISWD